MRDPTRRRRLQDIVDSDAETECAPATPKAKHAKLYFPKKGEKRTRGVKFQDWVEYDGGDVRNQEFPERYRCDDHGKTGVTTEYAKEDQYHESIIAAIRAAKAGELWENHAAIHTLRS